MARGALTFCFESRDPCWYAFAAAQLPCVRECVRFLRGGGGEAQMQRIRHCNTRSDAVRILRSKA